MYRGPTARYDHLDRKKPDILVSAIISHKSLYRCALLTPCALSVSFYECWCAQQGFAPLPLCCTSETSTSESCHQTQSLSSNLVVSHTTPDSAEDRNRTCTAKGFALSSQRSKKTYRFLSSNACLQIATNRMLRCGASLALRSQP